MTSPICHHFFLYSHGNGQYFPWSNFKKKDILVFSSLGSFRLGLSPYGLGEKGAPYFRLEQKLDHRSCAEFHSDSDGDGFNFLKPQLNPPKCPLGAPKNDFFQLWTRTKFRSTYFCRVSWRFRWQWFQSPKTDN